MAVAHAEQLCVAAGANLDQLASIVSRYRVILAMGITTLGLWMYLNTAL